MSGNKILIVSPVKNEEKYIKSTLDSVTSQTITPIQWIIVNDGSTDSTRSIIEEYAGQYDWIKIVDRKDRGFFEPGRGIIQAFNDGYKARDHDDYDYIIKLDCDLKFEPDYFERLIERFDKNDKLGIASGLCYQQNWNSEEWMPFRMPHYHTAGASKFMRRQCFKDIGGFIESRGWDTIDEIRAQMSGWETKHFPELRMDHLKFEGSHVGLLKTNAMHGAIYYLTGGGIIFLSLKVIDRMFRGHPFILGGSMLLLGFLKPFILRKQMLVTRQEAKFYRALLNKRILRALRLA